MERHEYRWKLDAGCLVACELCGRDRVACRIEVSRGETYRFICDEHPLSNEVVHPQTREMARACLLRMKAKAISKICDANELLESIAKAIVDLEESW